jgi:tyrosine-protein phosphatase SIW14
MGSLGRFSPRVSVSAVILALSVSGSLQARSLTTSHSNASESVRISNFGKVSDALYRGAQPAGRDYADLAAIGIKTVVDLRDDGEASEPGLVKQAGMNFVRIPMSGWERPGDAAVSQFLDIMNNPANLPVYVHCKVGKHRTGAMVALYRMTTDKWNAAKAYIEMQQYHFDVLLSPHTELKQFVFDYYAHLQQAATGKGSNR